jgi:hypothetical protein
MLKTLSKMNPEFLFGLLDMLDFQNATQMWIEMNPYRISVTRDDGLEIVTNRTKIYHWKGNECQRLLHFNEWDYVNQICIDWPNGCSLFVDEHFTEIKLHGFKSLPDVSGLPGPYPQNIVIRFL